MHNRLAQILMAGFLLLVAFMAWMLLAYFEQARQFRDFTASSVAAVEKFDAITTLIEVARYRTNLANQLIHTEDLFERDAINTELEIQAGRFARNREKLLASELSAADLKILEEQRVHIQGALLAQRRATELGLTDDPVLFEQARKILVFEVYPHQERIVDSFFQMLTLHKQEMTQRAQQTNDRVEQSSSHLLLLFAGVVVAVLMLLFYGVLRIGRELEQRVQRRTYDLELNQQSLIVAMERSEAAARAKSAFLANMSHEIRTPINAILGFIELSLNEQLPAQAHDYLQKSKRASQTLLGIINDILDFSKIEAGKMRIENHPFELRELIDSVFDLVLPAAAQKGLVLRVVNPDLPNHWCGDALRLRQVLLNLLSNAVKFTHQGEVVLILTQLQVEADRHQLQFAVRDSGIGMTPIQQQRLFQPFSQADDSTTRQFGGTGLGLLISKRLVEMMGGSVAVSSEYGVGSTFQVELWFERVAEPVPSMPVAPVSVVAESGGYFGRESLQGAVVLLVDDNSINREVGKGLLNMMGCEVVIATDGQEAVNAVRTNPRLELVLMDVQMPVLDGHAAAQIIRAEVTTTLPIIAMTANAMEGDRELCLTAGMNDYLAKPIDPLLLRQKLQQWLPAVVVVPES